MGSSQLPWVVCCVFVVSLRMWPLATKGERMYGDSIIITDHTVSPVHSFNSAAAAQAAITAMNGFQVRMCACVCARAMTAVRCGERKAHF